MENENKVVEVAKELGLEHIVQAVQEKESGFGISDSIKTEIVEAPPEPVVEEEEIEEEEEEEEETEEPKQMNYLQMINSRRKYARKVSNRARAKFGRAMRKDQRMRDKGK